MTQSGLSVAESWLETSDAVLRGLNHEFSNRLSLARLAPQLSSLVAAGEPQLERYAADAERAEDLLRLLRLYRLMVFASSEQAEPLLFSDVVPDAVDLFQHHTAFRDLEVRVNSDDTIPPVLMGPAALTQAVLLVLCAVARRSSVPLGDTGVLAIDFAADANAVRVAVRGDAVGPARGAGDSPEFPALRHLVRGVEGAVETVDGGAVLSVGTLVRLRQLEKRG